MMNTIKSSQPIRSRAVVVGLVMLMALVSGVATAQERELDITADYEIGDLDVATKERAVELTLDDALTLALERNLALLVQRYTYSQSILGIDENRGIYDLALDASYERRGNVLPVTTTLVETEEAAQTQDFTPWDVSLTQLFNTGGTLNLTWNSDRFLTNDQRRLLNPTYSSGVTVTATQPLLRNFGRQVTERNLIIAKTNRAISRENLQLEVERIIQEVSDGYWQLVEAREQLAVAEESLKLAKELHEMNRIQVEVGTLPPLDMVQSEAGVATREEEIIRRRAEVEDGEDTLRQLLNFDQGELWNVALVPISDPEIPFREIDTQAAIKAAIENRSDLKSQRLEIENRDIDLLVAHNQAKPEVDVSAAYGYSGAAGNLTNEAGDRLVSGDLSEAYSQIIDGDFENWSVSINFSYRLQNREAKARRAIAELALEQGEIELRQLQQSIMTEVRRSARAVRTAAQQIESAKVSSRLARENLKAEQKRYENGISTSFQILEIQEDLSEAQRREVSAVASYRRALIAYLRSTGELLSELNVMLSEPGSGDVE